jgi:hypothetical protein
MARPPKDKADRKDAELRIPVTETQKATIFEAARRAGEDMAVWARGVLLRAAQEQPTGYNAPANSGHNGTFG